MTDAFFEHLKQILPTLNGEDFGKILDLVTTEKKGRFDRSLLLAPNFNLEEIRLLRGNQKVHAIKSYRERTGCSLEEAVQQMRYFLGQV